MKYPECERCPDEDTEKCITCRADNKDKPMAAGIPEAIKLLKEDNEAFEVRLGNNAKLLLEYQVNQLAIEALEEKFKNDTCRYIFGSRNKSI